MSFWQMFYSVGSFIAYWVNCTLRLFRQLPISLTFVRSRLPKACEEPR